MVKSYGSTLGKGFGALAAAVSFGIFVYGNLAKKEEPAADCYASNDSNDALPLDALSGNHDSWVNVSARFQTLFLLGFWVNIIKLCVFVPIELYYIKQHRKLGNDTFSTADERDRRDPVPKVFRNLESLVGITELVWIILVFVWRLNHVGRVCSGEYLSD